MVQAQLTLGTKGYKHTLKEYVILTGFLLQHWLQEHSPMLRYSTLFVLFTKLRSNVTCFQMWTSHVLKMVSAFCLGFTRESIRRFLSFQASPRATWHWVASNMSSASHRLSEPALEGEEAFQREWWAAVSQQMRYSGQPLGNRLTNSHRFEMQIRDLTNRYSK